MQVKITRDECFILRGDKNFSLQDTNQGSSSLTTFFMNEMCRIQCWTMHLVRITEASLWQREIRWNRHRGRRCPFRPRYLQPLLRQYRFRLLSHRVHLFSQRWMITSLQMWYLNTCRGLAYSTWVRATSCRCRVLSKQRYERMVETNQIPEECLSHD